MFTVKCFDSKGNETIFQCDRIGIPADRQGILLFTSDRHDQDSEQMEELKVGPDHSIDFPTFGSIYVENETGRTVEALYSRTIN